MAEDDGSIAQLLMSLAQRFGLMKDYNNPDTPLAQASPSPSPIPLPQASPTPTPYAPNDPGNIVDPLAQALQEIEKRKKVERNVGGWSRQ